MSVAAFLEVTVAENVNLTSNSERKILFVQGNLKKKIFLLSYSVNVCFF